MKRWKLLGSQPNSCTLSSKVTTLLRRFFRQSNVKIFKLPQKEMSLKNSSNLASGLRPGVSFFNKALCILKHLPSSTQNHGSFYTQMKHHETTTPKSWQCPSDLLLYQKVFSLTKSSLLEIFTARGWDVMIYRGQGAVGPTDLARSEKVWRDSEILRFLSHITFTREPLYCSNASPQKPED